MIFGKSTMIFALIATIISAVYYLLAAREKSGTGKARDKNNLEFFKKAGRSAYYAMTGLIVIASFYLMYLFLTHQSQVQYVYQYSSRSLPFGLLLSSFWAGQQGSFLLWALLTAVMGLFLIRSADKFENYMLGPS